MKANAEPAIGVVPAQRRARRVAPERDSAFSDIDLPQLRHMRSGLIDEESRVSYWRRILQARLDLIRSRDETSVQLTRLTTVLADARSSHRRVAALSVGPTNDLEPLPDLAELWNRVVDEDDVRGREELVEQLQTAEADLSLYRRDLHARIDRVTGELIARYRENPGLALTALNERLMHR